MIRNATRQPIVSTRVPPTIGPRSVSAEVAAAQMPNARRAPRAVEGVGDERERARDEQRAGRALEEPEETSHSSVGARPHSADVAAKPTRPMRVDAPPAVVVGQRAGQDEQGGQDRQVAADDVGLALEDADERPGSSWPMLLRATLTIVPSRKTAPDPMTVQTRVQRWRLVMHGSGGGSSGCRGLM